MFTEAAKAGLSGATSGAAVGLGTSLLTGANYKQALRNAALSALVGGGISGTGVGIGTAIHGEPGRNETSPYTKRGSLGGGVAGALGGGVLSAALAGEHMAVPSKMPILGKLVGKNRLVAALLGSLAGGAGGAYMGADEGMQLDFFKNEMDAMRRKRRAEGLANG